MLTHPRFIARVLGTLGGAFLFVWPAAAADAPGDPVVDLPPFVITETKVEKPWRYAESAGFEIISQCDVEATQQVFAALWRGPRLTLPPSLQPHLATPTAVILFDQPPEKAGSVGALGTARAAHEESSHWTSVIKRTMPDREVFCLNLYDNNFRYSSTFRFDLRTLLALHTPPAPPWLIEALHGFYGLYREGIRYADESDESEIIRALWSWPKEQTEAEGLVSLARRRFKTVPGARTGPIAGASPVERFVAPLDTLWDTGVAPNTATADERLRWAATSALFARWGLYAENGRRHDAFWRFATQACAQPVTEDFFRACFGLTYAEAHAELGWFLPIALDTPASRQLAPLHPPKLKLRPATAAEVARVRGDWERGEASLLAAKFPDLAEKYRAKAGRTLRTAFANTPDDPRLAATLGLYELDAGNRARARELLELATAAGQARPRAWFTLAQLRLLDASAAPAGPKGELDSVQANAVLVPLDQALKLEPAMAMNYELMAELWRRSREVPRAEALEKLAEGQRAFPRNTRLALTAVRACLERGERGEALGFIDRSLPFTTDPAMRERLVKARAALTAAAMPASP
jgi:hypothetical protein